MKINIFFFKLFMSGNLILSNAKLIEYIFFHKFVFNHVDGVQLLGAYSF